MNVYTGASKDSIIAMGGFIHGSGVFQRYTLTEDKYSALKIRADQLGITTASMPSFGTGNYGKAYYDLFDDIVATLEALGTVEEMKAYQL